MSSKAGDSSSDDSSLTLRTDISAKVDLADGHTSQEAVFRMGTDFRVLLKRASSLTPEN